MLARPEALDIMSDQIDWDFADDEAARAQIGAAVKYLLRDTVGGARADLIRRIIDIVRDVADGLPAQPNEPDAGAVKQPAMSGVTYKAYVIDTFRRDADRWRATIRRSDGKKIRVASPAAVLDQATIAAEAISAEKAVEFAKKTIDRGGLI
jgi:hypothetical protein